mgnify:CR=1 FL=1
MTRLLFREDAYAKSCNAIVTGISERGIELDQTVFYATAGGQAGDIGTLKTTSGAVLPITTTLKDRETGRTQAVTLVGRDETQPSSGHISTDSPIGSALLDKAVGDLVWVQKPGGEEELEIIPISYPVA